MKNKKEKKVITKEKKRFRFARWVISWRIFKPLRLLYAFIRKRMEESIRFSLVVVIGICFLVSLITFSISNEFLREKREYTTIEYNDHNITGNSTNLAKELIETKKINKDDKETINNIVRRYYFGDDGFKIIITDLDGKVIYRTENVSQKDVDVYEAIKIGTKNEQFNNSSREKMVFFPITIGADKAFLFVYGYPTAQTRTYEEAVNNSFLALLLSVVAFILLFIYITNNKMKYIQEISDGLKVIASGDLDYRINLKGKDEFENLSYNINFMATEIQRKIEAERMAEVSKNELITNVSHDLRTPLTSVMGYIGLAKDGKYKDEEQLKEYLDISFSKAERLKVLIDDLFEYTKLTNAGIKLNRVNINLNEFIAQLVDEMIPLFEEKNKSIETNFTQEKVVSNLDTDKMLRVFENLLTNALKYSYENSKIEVSTVVIDDKCIVSVTNEGDNIKREKLNKLFDRFYRVDESRTSSTGATGSGLGLAISKNIVALHNGDIWAECNENRITFSVELGIIK